MNQALRRHAAPFALVGAVGMAGLLAVTTNTSPEFSRLPVSPSVLPKIVPVPLVDMPRLTLLAFSNPQGATISSCSGGSGANSNSFAKGGTYNLQINGANFNTTDTTVSVSGSRVTLGALTRNSSTLLTQSITIAGNATTDSRTVTVTSAGSDYQVSKTGCFNITPT